MSQLFQQVVFMSIVGGMAVLYSKTERAFGFLAAAVVVVLYLSVVLGALMIPEAIRRKRAGAL